MPLSAKTIRAQLAMFRPLLESCSLETSRKGQRCIGEIMEARYRRDVIFKQHEFPQFQGGWVIPRDERRQGVMLYLHGGGYVCGGLEYANGVSATLAAHCGMRVFCAAYRLAPEHPFPAALEDALEAYTYLLSKGYPPEELVLCGESAGGGLCYALCFSLREQGLPLPGGIIAISPWTDLTASGVSYETNRQKDPSMTVKMLSFYAKHYTDDLTDPLVSPLFGQLADMPPSLLFVGGDEIMLSDAEELHRRLQEAGSASQLVVRPGRWHGYVLYGLAEDREDFVTMNRFLNRTVAMENKLRWMPLDNAAKIYPAAQSHSWSNIFRLSATLTEPIDERILQAAVDVTVRRFPSIAVRLRRGMFWYYLQQVSHAPPVQQEHSYPLARMSRQETRRCAFRVIVYQRRIAVEFFHSVTDGTGGLIFLKTLVAEYLQQKYGVAIPAAEGVLGRLEEPSAEELEDSFQRHAGPVAASRREANAWHLRGTPEADGFLHLTCFQLPMTAVKEQARTCGVSVNTFLCGVMMQALLQLQREQMPPSRQRPVKVLLPVNLRRLFGSRTLRNFALYSTPAIDPRLGEYTFEEICRAIHHHMGLEVTPKQMSAKIATNINSERLAVVKVMPLFVKNLVMKAVFRAVGERKSCLSLSNLGVVTVPEAMRPYVERMDFVLGVQATAPHNCGVITYGDTVYVNMIRDIREPHLEKRFFEVLRDRGIPVQVESNRNKE